jgi:DNA-binding MarR family transcriptional regulator
VIWRAVPGHEDMYEVSDRGEIKSLPRLNGRGYRLKLRYLAGWVDDHGYRAVRIAWFGRSAVVRVHQIVAFAFHGPPPDGMEVRHLDGNQLHNCASNLTYGTRVENAGDAIRHGTHISLRHVCGEGITNAKLTGRQVAVIRARYAAGGIRQQDLADEYGVTQVRISQIVTGKHWKHITGPLRRPSRGTPKLTIDRAAEIRARYARGGISQQSLADEYGVGQALISKIIRNLSYREDAA